MGPTELVSCITRIMHYNTEVYIHKEDKVINHQELNKRKLCMLRKSFDETV